jgi:transposase-like protein
MDTKPLEAERQVRGEAIARAEGQIRRVWDGLYFVRSQHLDKEYQVSFDEKLGWSCSCPDFAYREGRLISRCKHVWAVQISIRIRHTVDGQRVIAEVSVSECFFCHSQRLTKFGVRHNKSGDIQRFECADCHRTFSVNVGFDRMKHNPKAITTALQLYFSGESLRATQRSLRLLGVEVSFKTIHNWIRKYVGLMAKYADQIKPEVGDTWRADELWVKVKGDMKYLFAMMDDQTRYWIAQEVADTKERADARNLFRRSAEIAGKKPETLITDGLRSYSLAFKKEYRNLYNDDGVKPVHIREIALTSRAHNNKMERMNGEIRDREKVMRGLQRSDTPILKGIQIYHNFIRPHEGLNGQTPAERAGIKVEGENKWLTLIQNASRANG